MRNALDQAPSRYPAGLASVAETATGEDFAPREERRCPVCGDAMHARSERGAVADVCLMHGVWFDQEQWVRFTSGPGQAGPVARRRAARGPSRRPYRDDLYESLFDLGGGD